MDVFSNLCQFLRGLIERGYVAPYKILDPECMTDSSRRRSFLPCAYLPGVARQPAEADILSRAAVKLMETLTSTTLVVLPFGNMMMDPDMPDFEFWFHHSLRDHTMRASLAVDDENLKWKDLHKSVYAQANLLWPPCIDTELRQLAQIFGLLEREVEILHYNNRANPMSQLCVDDAILDLSQSISRVHAATQKVCCVIPKGRFWWRRRKRWVLAKEIMMCQGFDATQASRGFRYRQIMDLFGNSFHAAPLLIAWATSLSMAIESSR